MTNSAEAPQPKAVGSLYDHRSFEMMAQLGDGNLHYGYWPSENDQMTLEEAMEEMTVQMIRRLGANPGDRILDIGCGYGTPARRLAQICEVEVVGISVSERQVARAGEYARSAGLSNRVRFELIDAMQLPFAPESFDGAWALESMFHMPDKARVLSGIARVLRPGGRFVIADLVYGRPSVPNRERAAGSYANAYASLTELTEYPKLIEEAGLTPLEVTDITAETSRSPSCYADRMRSQREQYIEMFGTSGYDMLIANHEAMSHMPELRYVMITATRP